MRELLFEENHKFWASEAEQLKYGSGGLHQYVDPLAITLGNSQIGRGARRPNVRSVYFNEISSETKDALFYRFCGSILKDTGPH